MCLGFPMAEFEAPEDKGKSDLASRCFMSTELRSVGHLVNRLRFRGIYPSSWSFREDSWKSQKTIWEARGQFGCSSGEESIRASKGKDNEIRNNKVYS
jgi:hypothetical protein